MSSTEGLKRGLEVIDTGKAIAMPVGEAVMGRVFNVTGDPVDEQGPVKADKYLPIHRAPPPLVDQSTSPQVLTTGIKVIDLICPFLTGRKIGAFGGAGVGNPLVILALLEERPRHGYEIIKALEETSKGFYAPSPGMVYPALTYLEEVGYATVEAEGSKKLYQITAAGLEKLNENRAFVDAALTQLARIGSKMERVRQAFAGDEPGDVGHRAVDEARQALRAALISKLNASPSAEELQRVSEVLKRATDELRRGKK
jgi:DNA-binding PadR family transcriptional regulator